MNKLLQLWKILQPILGKKIPMFSQSVSEFGTSKSNWAGGTMIVAGLMMLYVDMDNAFGILLLTNGIGLITLKDAAAKRNRTDDK